MSKIWVLRFQICDLRIFGLFVTFLVFMALKVKPKTMAEFSKPFDHIRAKKVIENHFFLSGLWCGLQKNLLGLFHFFWDISYLRSPLGCSNPISKFNIIPNSKWFKFPISNHSELLVNNMPINLCLIKDNFFTSISWVHTTNDFTRDFPAFWKIYQS